MTEDASLNREKKRFQGLPYFQLLRCLVHVWQVDCVEIGAVTNRRMRFADAPSAGQFFRLVESTDYERRCNIAAGNSLQPHQLFNAKSFGCFPNHRCKVRVIAVVAGDVDRFG
jgi:hypothetical protein